MNSIAELTDLLRVLQDPTRLRLLWVLRRGELSVGEVVQVTGFSQPRISRHLKLLCGARVVRRSPDQNEVYYRAAIDHDHRDLVAAILSSLSERDPVIARDRQRLTAILDSRQSRARALLARLGVRPLGAGDLSEVSAAIDDLLARRLPGSGNGEPLGDMLDVGTGTGSMLRLLASRARRTIAVDLSRDMRLIARATVLSSGLVNCTVRQGDMYDLEFPDGRFDLVTMDRVLGTADDPVAALGEAARVMNDGAHLLVIEPGTTTSGENPLERCLLRAGLSPVDLRSAVRDSVQVLLAAREAASGSARRGTRPEVPDDQ
ncbi:MAG: metalloregulator ArsR/SmtB family transcription factor [Proteobacteria bacterium]|nr:metalloregulator ArsR/SmtB family transcription factor [Pseudomonadota bacterium]MYJ94886.1 metalloregulator ArsR/SmtB family transcription factor [Pseudomonadota bacterium]